MLYQDFVSPPPLSVGDHDFVSDEPEPEAIDDEEFARIRLGTDGCPHCD